MSTGGFLTPFFGYTRYIETKHIMTFELKMTKEEIIDRLRSTFGVEFTAADVRGFCRANDIGYQTVTKKIKEFSVGRGKWNLEVTQKVVEEIENSFNALSVIGYAILLLGSKNRSKRTRIQTVHWGSTRPFFNVI